MFIKKSEFLINAKDINIETERERWLMMEQGEVVMIAGLGRSDD